MSRTVKTSTRSATLPNDGSFFSSDRASVFQRDHSPAVSTSGVSSALMRFMSAALPKLLMTIRSAHAGSAFTRAASAARSSVSLSTQMWSGESTSRAPMAIFSDIWWDGRPAKSIVNVSSLMASIRPMPHVRWCT